MARARSSRAALKTAHKLLQPTATLDSLLSVEPMARLLTAVAAGREAKLRTQRKSRRANPIRYEVEVDA